MLMSTFKGKTSQSYLYLLFNYLFLHIIMASNLQHIKMISKLTHISKSPMGKSFQIYSISYVG